MRHRTRPQSPHQAVKHLSLQDPIAVVLKRTLMIDVLSNSKYWSLGDPGAAITQDWIIITYTKTVMMHHAAPYVVAHGDFKANNHAYVTYRT